MQDMDEEEEEVAAHGFLRMTLTLFQRWKIIILPVFWHLEGNCSLSYSSPKGQGRAQGR